MELFDQELLYWLTTPIGNSVIMNNIKLKQMTLSVLSVPFMVVERVTSLPLYLFWVENIFFSNPRIGFMK